MKNHTVSIGTHIVHFKEVNVLNEMPVNGMQVSGKAQNITHFVKSLRLNEQWIPYGYCLRLVYRPAKSQNMTAFLFKLGQEIK
jgi:hypothetical protein